MEYTQAEILQTVRMTEMEHLDVRTVTLGLSLRDCVRADIEETAEAVREKIERTAARLVPTVDEIGEEFGLRIANKRISITPASLVADRARSAARTHAARARHRRGREARRRGLHRRLLGARPQGHDRTASRPSSTPSPKRWRRPSGSARR